MNKKILVISCFVVIFLLIPINSVIGTFNIDNKENSSNGGPYNDGLIQIIGVAHGKDGIISFSVNLTQDELNDVDILFENIRVQLKEADSDEEAELILKNAVVELNSYGLLGKLNIEDSQALVIGDYSNSKPLKYGKDQSEGENNHCTVVGKTTYTGFCSRVPRLNFMLNTVYAFFYFFSRYSILVPLFTPLLEYLDEHGLIDQVIPKVYKFINLRLSIFDNLFPFELRMSMTMGSYNYYHPSDHTPSSGWISTKGSNGVVEWEGDTLYGNTGWAWYHQDDYGSHPYMYCEAVQKFSGINYYLGNWMDIISFTSLKMLTGDAYYVGYADYVNIAYEFKNL